MVSSFKGDQKSCKNLLLHFLSKDMEMHQESIMYSNFIEGGQKSSKNLLYCKCFLRGPKSNKNLLLKKKNTNLLLCTTSFKGDKQCSKNVLLYFLSNVIKKVVKIY